MSCLIDKQFMYNELKNLLKIIFELPEMLTADIKGITIKSANDEQAISSALNTCYHDMYSDIDMVLHIKLNSAEYNGSGPIYADCMSRLGFENNILGLLHKSLEHRGELIRVCKINGMRYDFQVYANPADDIPLLPHKYVSENIESVDQFWFIAIQALGKLMRKDYLISAHLAHTLIQEGLVQQMVKRDKEHNTNIHRYGYAEDLDYLNVMKRAEIPFGKMPDETYNYISKLLYSAVKSYDRLNTFTNDSYKPRIDSFLEIWANYTTNEMTA